MVAAISCVCSARATKRPRTEYRYIAMHGTFAVRLFKVYSQKIGKYHVRAFPDRCAALSLVLKCIFCIGWLSKLSFTILFICRELRPENNEQGRGARAAGAG